MGSRLIHGFVAGALLVSAHTASAGPITFDFPGSTGGFTREGRPNNASTFALTDSTPWTTAPRDDAPYRAPGVSNVSTPLDLSSGGGLNVPLGGGVGGTQPPAPPQPPAVYQIPEIGTLLASLAGLGAFGLTKRRRKQDPSPAA